MRLGWRQSRGLHRHVARKSKVPPKLTSHEKKPSPSPPLQNAKVQLPSPPRVIQDETGSLRYQRMSFLGEGGFTGLYHVRDSRNNYLSCKVVTKSSLKTKKAKTKFHAEIKIHETIDHLNIVQFMDCFEDDENVYLTLELCFVGSLMGMFHRRRVFTEPEAQFFMMQLIGAYHYMHTHRLGNLVLDADMNIKVGDFGLAALIESPGERKKIICGTPNYICAGVPSHRDVSLDARELVQQVLTPNAQERPSLHDIVNHAFFTRGIVPGYIPVSARDIPPECANSMGRLRATSCDIEPPVPSASSVSSLAQQEREFRNAVQPGSPISVLLSSARQPLMEVPGGVGVARGEPTLLRKLQAAKKEALKSPAKTQRATRLQGTMEEDGAAYEMQGEEARTKELQSPKARIVAQMVPAQVSRSTTKFPSEDAENVPAPAVETVRGERRVRVCTKETQVVLGSSGGAVATAPTPAAPKVNGFDAAAETLRVAFDALSQDVLFRDPSGDEDMSEERVFIASWARSVCASRTAQHARPRRRQAVCHLSFVLLYGVLIRYGRRFNYILSRRQGTVYVSKNYTVADYPEDLKSMCMHFVQKYLRMKHVIVFKLSHDALQAQGLAIAHIDKRYVPTRWALSQVMAQALVPPSSDADTAMEVLLSIRNTGTSASSGGGSENGGGTSTKPSKASPR
ncbi:kinase-like domain-containing protein [Lactarius indigo]|nr:kinase-like domain-containing protein [Lactarius indigo]